LIGVQLKLLLLQPLFKMVSKLEFQDKMLKEEPSLIDMLMSSTKIRMDITIQSILQLSQIRKNIESLLLPTLIFQSSLLWDTSLVMLRHAQTPLLFGKPNLVILPTVLKLSSINSFHLVKLNGMLKMDLSSFYLMVMMVMVQNTPLAEQRDGYFCVIKTVKFHTMDITATLKLLRI